MISAVPTIFGSRLKRRSQIGVAEHHRLRALPGGLLGVEPAAQHRLHAEHVEEVLRHRHAAQPLGFPAAAEQVVADAVEREVAGDRRERLRALPQIQHVPHLRRLAGQPAGVAVGDPHQLGRPGERQRPQQQRVDHAEDDDARADAEPGDQDGEDGKSGVPPQGAGGVAEVLEQVREHHRRPLTRWRDKPLLAGATRRSRPPAALPDDSGRGAGVALTPSAGSARDGEGRRSSRSPLPACRSTRTRSPAW